MYHLFVVTLLAYAAMVNKIIIKINVRKKANKQIKIKIWNKLLKNKLINLINVKVNILGTKYHQYKQLDHLN